MASGFSLTGGPPTSCNVKLGQHSGFGQHLSGVFIGHGQRDRSGVFKPG